MVKPMRIRRLSAATRVNEAATEEVVAGEEAEAAVVKIVGLVAKGVAVAVNAEAEPDALGEYS